MTSHYHITFENRRGDRRVEVIETTDAKTAWRKAVDMRTAGESIICIQHESLALTLHRMNCQDYR